MDLAIFAVTRVSPSLDSRLSPLPPLQARERLWVTPRRSQTRLWVRLWAGKDYGLPLAQNCEILCRSDVRARRSELKSQDLSSKHLRLRPMSASLAWLGYNNLSFKSPAIVLQPRIRAGLVRVVHLIFVPNLDKDSTGVVIEGL
ncbi:hypothetical protein F5887DRAFT_915025 [Amanita rubescens]|nr:hypothetical protein F5887DRAFT_915025 [Amanita rubescens]